jgi:hypothetical protein
MLIIELSSLNANSWVKHTNKGNEELNHYALHIIAS